MSTLDPMDATRPHSLAKGDLFEDVAFFEWHDETKEWKINSSSE